MWKRVNQEDFIKRAIDVHGEKYEYTLVYYKNMSSKVKIICKKHGIFEQNASSHLQGKGCIKCSGLEKMTTDIFIKKSNVVHDNKYDYSSTVYINSHVDVIINCPEHGDFIQKAHKHLAGRGCKLCGYEKLGNLHRSNTEEFIKKAKVVHGEQYNYGLVNYFNNSTSIEIICKRHGIFNQIPKEHLIGHGCPSCNRSKLEIEVKNFLTNTKLIFEEQKRFDFIRNEKSLPFDFYLPDYNCCIECQGEQHFKKFRFRGYSDSEFNKIIFNDKIKFNKCKEYKINLFYFCQDLKFVGGEMYNIENTFNDPKLLFEKIQKYKK